VVGLKEWYPLLGAVGLPHLRLPLGGGFLPVNSLSVFITARVLWKKNESCCPPSVLATHNSTEVNGVEVQFSGGVDEVFLIHTFQFVGQAF